MSHLGPPAVRPTAALRKVLMEADIADSNRDEVCLAGVSKVDPAEGAGVNLSAGSDSRRMRLPARWRGEGTKLRVAALLALAACTASGPAPTPPPTKQFIANCSMPTYATDVFVCEDPALRGLDAELTALWTQVDADPRTTVADREVQATWFRKRSKCSFEVDQAGCVEASYRGRIGELRRAKAR